MAHVDYFLKFEGGTAVSKVEGESADAKHKGEVDVESWSWGESNVGTHAIGGGGGAGKVSMQDFHFVMKMSKASPSLFLACATGDHLKSAVLTCRKAGGEQQEFLIITMNDLLVSSYQTGGSAHGDIVPTDQISLNFSKFKIDYKVQNEKGAVTGSNIAGWDVKANKKL